MSRALLDELLAGFVAPTPAKVANPANREDWRRQQGDSSACQLLRSEAKPEQVCPAPASGSHAFAAVRSADNTPYSEQRHGPSQRSQDSQGVPGKGTAAALGLAAVAWTDDDIARFLDRLSRLLRWGWSEPDAETVAERLTLRDRRGDDRVSCSECQHYRPGRCGSYRRAGLQSPDVGRHLAAMLQRCPAFMAVQPEASESERAQGHEID